MCKIQYDNHVDEILSLHGKLGKKIKVAEVLKKKYFPNEDIENIRKDVSAIIRCVSEFVPLTKEILDLYKERGEVTYVAKNLQKSHFKELSLSSLRRYTAAVIRWSRDVKVTPNNLYKPIPENSHGTSQNLKNVKKLSDGTFLHSLDKTETPITSEEEAVEFWNIDLSRYDIKEFEYSSWDVTMKMKVPYDKETGKRVEPGDTAKDIFYRDEDHKRVNFRHSFKTVPIQKLDIKELKVEPFQFKTTSLSQMWVILGCVHRPFHNKKIWKGILNFLYTNKESVSGIILNGDYLDLRSLSTHDEYIPEGIDLQIEYTDGLLGINELKEAIGAKKWKKGLNKVFHYGNHEDRYLRDKKILRKYGSALLSPEEALRLNENNFIIQYDWKNGFTGLGNDLEVFHGTYYSLNAAKKHLDMIPEKSCIFNHTHRQQSYDNGRQIAYNIGWLGDVNSSGFRYGARQTRSAWSNGFGIAYIDDNGGHSVNSIKCVKDKFFFGGKIFG